VPSGLGIYWVTNNSLSTLSSVAIKQYFKMNPPSFKNVDLEKLASSSSASTYNSVWGYRSEAQMTEEAKLNYRPVQTSLIPEDFAV
jgi:membrane protein insertase Oxa1/YidC/SpoIIIJ